MILIYDMGKCVGFDFDGCIFCFGVVCSYLNTDMCSQGDMENSHVVTTA